MGATARQGFVFGMGLVLGIVAGGSLLAGYKGDGVQKAAAAPVQAASASAICGFDPVLAGKSGTDKFSGAMDGAGKDARDVPAYIAVGNDVAQQGRARDAEIAFITACRIAGRFAGADSVEVADAKYHLAMHYTNAAGNGESRGPILKRAQALLSESVTSFGAKLGIADEKTALAAGGLSRLNTALVEAEVPRGVPQVLLAERSSPDYGVAMVNTSAMGAAAERKAARTPTQGTPEAVGEPAPTEAPVTAAVPRPADAPVCIGGDCPSQERMVREREADRESAPAMQASRKLTMRAPTPTLPPAPLPQAPSQATGSANGSPAQPFAP